METFRAIVAFSALAGGAFFYFGKGTIDLTGVSLFEISGNHLVAGVFALIGLFMAVRRG